MNHPINPHFPDTPIPETKLTEDDLGMHTDNLRSMTTMRLVDMPHRLDLFRAEFGPIVQ